MRVTSGSARGRNLKAVEGECVRPTGNKVKQAIFSVLQFELAGRTVLDLFSGSGQMGIEALSRGAKKCIFVDNLADSVQVTKENLQAAGLAEQASVERASYESFLRSTSVRFDLVFLDPPYQKGMVGKALELLVSCGLLDESAIVAAEMGVDEEAPDACGKLTLWKEKRYRDTKVRFYRFPVEGNGERG